MLNDKKNFLSFRIFWPLVIVIISLLMSVAYTTVNYVSLAVDGDAVAMQYKGVFIYDIQYKNNNSSNYTNDLLKVVSNTLINSYVELSSTNSSSSTTYTITVLNNDDTPAHIEIPLPIDANSAVSLLDCETSHHEVIAEPAEEENEVAQENNIRYTMNVTESAAAASP